MAVSVRVLCTLIRELELGPHLVAHSFIHSFTYFARIAVKPRMSLDTCYSQSVLGKFCKERGHFAKAQVIKGNRASRTLSGQFEAFQVAPGELGDTRGGGG